MSRFASSLCGPALRGGPASCQLQLAGAAAAAVSTRAGACGRRHAAPSGGPRQTTASAAADGSAEAAVPAAAPPVKVTRARRTPSKTRGSAGDGADGDSASATSATAAAAASVADASPAPAVAPTRPRRTRTKPPPAPPGQDGGAGEPAPAAPAAKPSRARRTSASKKAAPAAPSEAAAAASVTPSLQEQPQAAPATRPAGRSGVLLVVDGNYLANRAYYGYGSGGRLATRGGVPTSITYSVVRTLRAAIRSVRPTALAVVFDHRGPTFRAALSVLDPSSRTRAGDAAARLVQQGRLDWTDLANRLLAAEPLRADLRAVGAAQAGAGPRAYLHPSSNTFLPPAGTGTVSASAAGGVGEAPPDAAGAGAASSRAAGGWNATYGATSPATSEDGGDVVRMLAAALGPELAAECGLTETVAALEAAAAAGGGRVVLPPQAYKAGRTPKDEEFYVDFRNLQRLLGLMAIPPLSRPWLEADDLAGLLVHQAVSEGLGVRVLTGDRDLFQLVDDAHDVALLYPRRGGSSNNSSSSSSSSAPASASSSSGSASGAKGAKGPSGASGAAAAAAARRWDDFPFDELRESAVVGALGVAPGLVADYKALTGDDSDRLPGVTGIGPKGAVQLLAQFGSLAGVRRAVLDGEAGGIAPKRRAALQADWPAAQYTLTMARVLGSPGAPSSLPPGEVLPDRLLQRLQLRGYEEAGAVAAAMEELEMWTLAREAGPGGQLWRDFGGGSGGGGGEAGAGAAQGGAGPARGV
ncbi:hypothetical protein HYH02_009973 [Chlamydomonas schloesseri]|uniref:5'-3' exonuclease domain-containing protein n=1 Tax=Chlamydomonas schloesseri TaxID=2026947 RepID=A0A835TA26_9CHLO|nr:hypothetical protein HYH02_009973 [Chlamydomonas schloesseri]|eukprot:KAG2441383.1 hypothetical protein HYH02_009973 [Chlamydomonas schloesseri]